MVSASDPARFVRKSRLRRTSGLFDSAANFAPLRALEEALVTVCVVKKQGCATASTSCTQRVPCITVSSTMTTKRRSNTEVADRLNEFHFEGANKPGGELINLAHWMFGCIPLHC